METLAQDLRYGFRMLVKNPGFTAVVVLTLALGIGANSAIFSFVNAVLLTPLPYAHADRLVELFETNPQMGLEQTNVSFPDYLDWKEQNQVFEQMTVLRGQSFSLTDGDNPEYVRGGAVAADFFPLLGVAPLHGRTLVPEDEQGGRVAVIGHALWQRRFNSDPALVGRPVELDGQSFRVVGVMPPSFKFGRAELWVPLDLGANRTRRDSRVLTVIARLKPRVTPAQAEAEMGTIAARLEQEYPDTNASTGVALVPLSRRATRHIRSALLVLLGAVALLLLVTCANIINLLLARAAARQKEFAIRASLGASRSQLIRQLLTESVLLSVLGGALGLLLAFWMLNVLVAIVPPDLVPGEAQIGVDARVLGFTLALSLLVGVVFSLAPALYAARPNLSQVLKPGGEQPGAGRRSSLAQHWMVVAQVCLALILLNGAFLMIRSLRRLEGVDPGFDPEGVLTMEVTLPRAKYPNEGAVVAFHEQVLSRLEALPGVQSAASVLVLPPSGEENYNWDFTVEGEPPPGAGQEGHVADFQVISPNYFRTMGIPVRSGRDFSDFDGPDSPPAVIVNEKLARRFWPDGEAVGKRIMLGGGEDWASVVGVVGDVRHYTLDAEAGFELYAPLLQTPRRSMSLVVRAARDPQGLAAEVRREVQAVDKGQAVYNVKPMTQVLSESLGQRSLATLLLGVFAAVAVLLAALGVYGVMAYSVTRRTQEIGIRMALGAQRGAILRLILRQGMALVLVGLAIGLAGSFMATRLISSLLYGISATDAPTFVMMSLLLAAVALLANYIPGRRATKVDPLVALRQE